MSLIGNNPNRYDYGGLSPTLDALLAEGCQDLQALPGFDVTMQMHQLLLRFSMLMRVEAVGRMSRALQIT